MAPTMAQVVNPDEKEEEEEDDDDDEDGPRIVIETGPASQTKGRGPRVSGSLSLAGSLSSASLSLFFLHFLIISSFLLLVILSPSLFLSCVYGMTGRD